MRKKVTRILAVLMMAALVLVMTSCREEGSGGPTVDKVVMTYVTSPLNVPSLVEKEQGLFAESFGKLNLDFEYADLDSGADQTAALASGDIQFLNAVGGSSVILAAANGSDIQILSMYSRAPKAFCMYSNDESIQSPEALKGRTIAGPKGTNLHELLAAYLATADLTIADVNYVDMDIPSAVAALEGGSIDVALVGGAAAYNCEKSGRHLVTDGEGLIAATICTAASRKFVEENPEVVETFLQTQKSIVEKMNADTAAALDLTAEKLDMDRQAVEEMYALYDFNTAITEEDIIAMQGTEGFLYDSGMIEDHVEVKNLIY